MINNNLTILYKKILQETGLVNSGKLMNSIIVETSLVGAVLTINVRSLPYLVYLIKPNNLTTKFTMSQTFNNEVGSLLYSLTEDAVDDILNGKESTVPDIQIIIKYNGV